MSRPSCCAGPESATDWPSTIRLSVTPCARAEPAANASAASDMRIMESSALRPSTRGPGDIIPSGPRAQSAPLALQMSPGEELAHLVHEALGPRVVAVAVAAVDVLELAQQLALALGELYGGLDHHLAEQFAGIARAHALDALAAQAEDLPALGPGLRPRAVAGLAGLHGRDTDLGLGAACRLLERDLEVVAQVGAAEDGSASASLPVTEDVAEDVAEGLGEAAEARRFARAHAAHLGIHAGVAVGVVGA